MYSEQGVCIWIFVNITYQDTNTCRSTNQIRRLQLNVYTRSIPKLLRLSLVENMEVGIYPISLQHQKRHPFVQSLACPLTVT